MYMLGVFHYRRTCWVCSVTDVHAGCVLLQTYMLGVFHYRRTCWACSVTDVHAGCVLLQTYMLGVFCYRRTCWVCCVTDVHAGCVPLQTYMLGVLCYRRTCWVCCVTDVHAGCVVLQTYMLGMFCYRRTCWVCFASDEDDREAEWVRPCCCRGTTKWVHQLCLQRWIDEKQKGNSTAKVQCPQCGKEYLIVFPKVGKYGSRVLSEFKTRPVFLARVVIRSPRFSRSVLFLKSLHWL